MAPAMFSDRDDFLAHGIERAECSICKELFDGTHWPYQIRRCGHAFGRPCLEAWLRQSDSEGTCPECRNVLFRTESDSDSEDELEWESTEEERESEAQMDRHERGCALRLLDMGDSSGFLVKLWKEMVDAFGPDERETSESAWDPRIIGLNWYLIQGLGLLDDNHDRAALNRELEAHRACLVAFDLSRGLNHIAREIDYSFLVGLSSNMIQISRLSRHGVIPDPVLWRAMIRYHTLMDEYPPVINFIDGDEDILYHGVLTEGFFYLSWYGSAARLYFLLVLMAQDCKHNLRPSDIYDAEDVAKLLRSLHTPIRYGRRWECMGDRSEDFCERAARFYHGAQINNPCTVPSKELADYRTRIGLIFCHVRGFWSSAQSPDTVAYDTKDDHMRFGIEQGFIGADGEDDGSEAGDDARQQVAEEEEGV
ncbi:hypothetical protein G6011_01039 [Alternaria panax]|uniref:RING-type domain-containing protein n=1 Tax=Alternaria panax TaxID=48097 RepID=A0AAD4IJD5_9PLEO|nr:hypothetical protein G6011_01039 [Alternaria panax]